MPRSLASLVLLVKKAFAYFCISSNDFEETCATTFSLEQCSALGFDHPFGILVVLESVIHNGGRIYSKVTINDRRQF